MNAKVQELKNTIRNPFAWPGGYTVTAIMDDGEVLCHDCLKENFREILQSTKDDSRDGWTFAGAGVMWEGPPMYCAHCNKEMSTEYGDPS